MDKLLKRIFTSSIITSIILLIIGILLIVASEITLLSISYIIGATILSLGVLAVVRYFMALKGNKAGYELNIVYGVITSFVGSCIIMYPKSIASIIPIIIGIGILINSSIKLEYAFLLKRHKSDIWRSTMLMAAISLLCGILLIFNPFKSAVFITRLIGAFIVVYAVLDIIGTIRI